MRGRYYLKHTINHTISNNVNNKHRNEDYKQTLIENAVYHLKYTNDDINKKIDYLKSLTHDVYRNGTKYRYSCNLNSIDIESIIKKVNDDELFKAYFGESIEEYDSKNARNALIILAVSLLIILIVFLN